MKKPEAKAADAVGIFSPDFSGQVLSIMREVVEYSGTGTRARLTVLQVGGKTCTALKAGPTGG
ncbi:hypothetical protein DQK91_21970 [Oceanidesulfovibrio marinus]|uniref:Uncharacterized protein n=1 Tax=Oceanidesulfovibrio marinus TaxID=370038 RepID=A0A6P1ZBI5_9BACT|nr:hypothetical protein DQK91_21970 [Oceanidesulfovibrio marinus]